MKKLYTIFVTLLSIHALPQSGTLDASFGDNGKVSTGFSTANNRANAVAIQPDGKIIMGGFAHTANTVNSWEKDSDNFILVRYNADGNIDNTFGYMGKVMTDFYPFFINNTRNSAVYTIRLQSDGKILAYGNAGSETIVARYNSNGSLDINFGTNGIIRCNSGPVEGNNSLTIQPDGKIVVLGIQWTQPALNVWNSQFVVERYNSDGSIDTSFATDGKAITTFIAGYNMPKAITMQADGKILVVGTSSNSLNYLAIARYTVNGVLDTTFDGDGKVISPIIGSASFVTAHEDGKVLVAATTFSSNVAPTIASFTLLQYNSNGTPDGTFDGDGIATNPFDANDASYNTISVSEQPDGKFLVTTSADPYGSYGNPDDFVIRRYNSNGTVDFSFGVNGKAVTTPQPGFNIAKSVTIQADGKILVVGYSRTLPSEQYSSNLVRYQSNGTLDTTFGNDGKVTPKFDATNDDASILLIQPDNKLIAIGIKRNSTQNGYLFKDIALSRYNGNGSPDTSFGTEGKVISAIEGNMNKITCGILQPDGKIVAANSFYNTSVDNLMHYELIRYNDDGTIDTAYGTNGKVIADSEATAMLSQPDGKIITVSIGYDSQSNAALILKRYNNDGTPDNGFGNNGTAGMAGTFFGSVSAVVQPDGKIVVSYSSPDSNQANGFTAVRFHSNGILDTDFVTGITVVDNASYANGVFIQSDGKVIVAGRSIGFSEGYLFYQFVTTRYNSNGSLDSTYGSNGTTQSYLGSTLEPYNIIRSVVLQPDGKFLVALTKEEQNPANPSPNSYDFVIYRFNSDGSYDDDFGVNGKATTSFYTKYDEAFAMILQPDHKIVIAGTTDTGINRDFALVRYNNTVALDATDFTVNNDAGVFLYPNPAKNVVNLSGPDAATVIDCSVYDSLGKAIYTGNALQIDTTRFSTGIYTVRINTKKGVVNIKFLKE